MIITKKLSAAIIAAMFVLIFCISAFGATITVNAADKYSHVVEDLQKDPNFKVTDFPVKSNDYSLKVLQVAEGEDGDVFVYVYQPCGNKTINATSINISTTADDKLSFRNYKLEVLNRTDVLVKYRVIGLVIPKETERLYNVSSIYRRFYPTIDKQSEGDTTTEKSFTVGKQFNVLQGSDGTLKYSCLDTDVVVIDSSYVGRMRLSEGFEGWQSLSWLKGNHGISKDYFFVSFSTDKNIDYLIEADVSFVAKSYAFHIPYFDSVCKPLFGSATGSCVYYKVDESTEYVERDGKFVVAKASDSDVLRYYRLSDGSGYESIFYVRYYRNSSGEYIREPDDFDHGACGSQHYSHSLKHENTNKQTDDVNRKSYAIDYIDSAPLTISHSAVDHTGNYLLAPTYKWDRIMPVDDFISVFERNDLSLYKGAFVDINYSNTLTVNNLELIRGTDPNHLHKWVLQFYDAPYVYDATIATFWSGLMYWTDIEQFAILRLKFKTNGTVYNLGVVADKKVADQNPSNVEKLPTPDLSQSLKNFFGDFAEQAKKIIMIVLIVIAFIILLPVLPLIIRIVVFVVSLPFKIIGTLVKGFRRRSNNNKRGT